MKLAILSISKYLLYKKQNRIRKPKPEQKTKKQLLFIHLNEQPYNLNNILKYKAFDRSAVHLVKPPSDSEKYDQIESFRQDFILSNNFLQFAELNRIRRNPIGFHIIEL